MVRTTSLLLLALAGSACAPRSHLAYVAPATVEPAPTPPSAPTSPRSEPEPGTVVRDFVEAGHLAGDLGDITHFDSDATQIESRLGHGTFVKLDAVRPGQWVMLLFEVELDPDDLEPGATYTFGAIGTLTSSTAPPRPGELFQLRVLGCSGPVEDEYTFDDTSTQTVLRVEVLPDGLHRVHFDCTFGSQVVSGSFDYAPAERVEGI